MTAKKTTPGTGGANTGPAAKSTTATSGTGKPRARKAATPPPIAATPDAAKPLYAYIGAGELAVTRLRELSDPARLRALAEPVRSRASAEATRIASFADAARAGELVGVVKTIPSQLRGLQAKVQETAAERYVEFSARGEQVVSGIRAQGLSEQAEKAARSTVAHAKAARTGARKTVEALASAALQAGKMK